LSASWTAYSVSAPCGTPAHVSKGAATRTPVHTLQWVEAAVEGAAEQTLRQTGSAKAVLHLLRVPAAVRPDQVARETHQDVHDGPRLRPSHMRCACVVYKGVVCCLRGCRGAW